MFSYEFLFRLIPSIISICCYTVILYKYANRDFDMKILLFNSISIMTLMLLYIPETGLIMLMIINYINGVLLLKITKWQCIRITLMCALVGLTFQSLFLYIYVKAFGFDQTTVAIPATISTIIEYIVLSKLIKLNKEDIIKGVKHMVAIFWVGDKEKRSAKEYKESLKK